MQFSGLYILGPTGFVGPNNLLGLIHPKVIQCMT